MTDGKYLEIEVKFYVPSLDEVETRLKQIGATLGVPRVYEHNIRYENADHTLTTNGIVVRLRQDKVARFTYKEPSEQLYDGIATRFEAEVEVSDFDAMNLILERLGFSPFLIYEKYRTTYHLDDAEIVLDEMPYGTFIEIEGAAQQIENIVTELGLENQPRITMNYIQIFDALREHLKLDFTDITFANFEGIDIPNEIFALAEDQ